MSNTTLPYGVSQQLEDLRGCIRGCDEALKSFWLLEKWEVREFQETRDDAAGKLAQWEASIALAGSL